MATRKRSGTHTVAGAPGNGTPRARAAAPDGGAAAPGEPRRPQQERGQRRVDAILEAAAAIVAEEGVAAATMHAIAKRSGTTIGSMYHFFPDREAVLVALMERHGRAIGALAAELTTVDWSRLALEEVVDRYVDELLGYAREHPDLLPVIHTVIAAWPNARRDDAPEQLLVGLAESIVAARTPRATAAERAARASMMLAAVEGVVERSARVPSPSAAVLHRELKRVLVGYLRTFE